MREIIIIKTDNSEKLRNLLDKGELNYSIIYDDILSELFPNKNQLAQAYEEWANDPNEWKDIKEKY